MTPHRRRIGFVDLNVDNFHANVYLAALRNELKDRGFAVSGCTALKVESGRAWAEKNGVPWYDSVEALAPDVDFFMVLAPSNPEVHLPLCEQVFPFGKPTFVDKTFAPDLDTARRIFALADRYGVPVQTSSALRYTNVQKYVAECGQSSVRHMFTWGSGTSFQEYAIHPVEMAISCLGPDARELMRRGDERFVSLLVNFSGDRSATVNVHLMSKTPYSAVVVTEGVSQYIQVDRPPLFIHAAAAILDFFESGRPLVPRSETLAIRRILDVAEMPEARGRFVPL